MLTPIDIQNKTFDVKFRGYNCEEVDDFVDILIKDYEQLYKDNISLKDKITTLSGAIEQYKSMEDTLQNSIILAQTASEDIRRNAEEKAGTIIKEAELESKKRLQTANEQLTKLNAEISKVKMEVEIYKGRIKGICSGLLEMLDKME